jgi:hypothetical protein
MVDIFVSYESSDRPRAEALRSLFEQFGWSVWIDREIPVGEEWEAHIDQELNTARLIVVLWGAQARRSEWVQREAGVALKTNRLLQIHATGLPLLPPFDVVQAVRMQSWSGESAHSEQRRLLEAAAQRLGAEPSVLRRLESLSAELPRLNYDLGTALELAFHYCARQVECRRLAQSGDLTAQNFDSIRESFSALCELLGAGAADDREGILHRMVEDFQRELERLVPMPGAVR